MPLKPSSRLLLSTALLVWWLVPVAALDAQATNDRRAFGARVPATIALVDASVDDLGGEAPGAVIQRRTDLHPHDVILVARAEASAELLSAAVFTLLVARDLLGDVPEETATIPVRQMNGPRAWKRRIVPRLGRLLARLRSAEASAIAGIGVVPRVTVWLPADYDAGLDRVGAAAGHR